MTINLPDELRNAVSARPLAPLEIIDEQSQVSYVVMPMQVYREMMGVGTDAEHADSLAAIHEGLADVDAVLSDGARRPVLPRLGSQISV